MSLQLFPFQKEGVAFVEKRNGRALIADEMGLGKTIQAIAWLNKHSECLPAVIVCPASLKLNWEKELQTWSAYNTQVLSGTKPTKLSTRNIYIINYDVLHSWVTMLQTKSIKALIFDECHLFKNSSAKRTKAVKRISNKVSNIICLSGTPIVNRPIEILNAIKILDPITFRDQWRFMHRYCGAKHNGFGWDFNGASNIPELHKILCETVMIRRLKKDVLTELPDKTHSFIPIELTNRKEYQTAEKDIISFIRQNKGSAAAQRASNAEVLTRIETLKQVAVNGKLDGVIDWIEMMLSSTQKLVVFATHKFVIDALMSEFNFIDNKRKSITQAVKIDGSCSIEDRQKAVNSFQNDPSIRLFIGNIKAAGVGITLTAASNVVFVEFPWTPGDLSQASDRCHRIGQKNNVNVYYLFAHNTIETKIIDLLRSKQKVLDGLIDGIVTTPESLFSELLETFK